MPQEEPEQIIQIKQDDYQPISFKQKLEQNPLTYPSLIGAKIRGAGDIGGKSLSRYQDLLDGIYFDTAFESADGYYTWGGSSSLTVNYTGLIISLDNSTAAYRGVYKNISAGGASAPTWDKDREMEFSVVFSSNAYQTLQVILGTGYNSDGVLTSRHIGILLKRADATSILYITNADGTTQKITPVAEIPSPSGGSTILQIKLRLRAGRYLEYSGTMKSADGTSKVDFSTINRVIENIPTGTTDATNLFRAYAINGESVAKTITIPYYRFMQQENK